jgi:hypothetical protein
LPTASSANSTPTQVRTKRRSPISMHHSPSPPPATLPMSAPLPC